MTDPIRFRTASLNDLNAIVAMLADDPLGQQREDHTLPLSKRYLDAFSAIDTDSNNQLLVAKLQQQLIAVLQLSFIPSLTYQGSWRAQIEGVRVHSDYRNSGVGRELLQHAIERARQHGCRLVQLTTDKARPQALRFYQKLGFTASHEGLKLRLSNE